MIRVWQVVVASNNLKVNAMKMSEDGSVKLVVKVWDGLSFNAPNSFCPRQAIDGSRSMKKQKIMDYFCPRSAPVWFTWSKK